MHPLVDKLNLLPHPEGGYYREVYRSSQKVLSPVHQQPRNTLTSIYFLLLKGQVSRFHKVLHDEIWHFYEGDPLRLIDSGESSNEIILGNNDSTPTFQHTINAGHWQAAETTGEYTLAGCTVAPGFDFADFNFLPENQTREFLAKHPELERFI